MVTDEQVRRLRKLSNMEKNQKIAASNAGMDPTAARRMESAKRERVSLDSGTLIHVERNSYWVNSRLIGAQMEARLYLDHIEVWYGCRTPTPVVTDGKVVGMLSHEEVITFPGTVQKLGDMAPLTSAL